MKRLYLVRHGETNWNLKGRVQGTKDVLLTDLGEKQAKCLAKVLKNEKINQIYSSNLNRALTTAIILGNELNIPVKMHNDLREINFGIWQGLTMEEIKKSYRDEHHIWRTEPHKLCLKDAETLQEVRNRTLKLVNEFRKIHLNENILIVSHGTSIKALILGILDIELSNYKKLSIGNTGLTVIEFREYSPVLIKFNDLSHLKEVKR